ncbi:hypothetical protein [Salipiger sp. PrR003]|uniref:hypothetical protein n=1 Tax=Salipiger sp. PrR003 TaxID=2706776 RepID=UPI0013DB11A5|nr:hypothetical protein [Salipiger sp. PrR003]NDV50801.1 hypothetical protein [Salipiger sp. PrR003]
MFSTLIDLVLLFAVTASMIVSVVCYRRMQKFKDTVEELKPLIAEFCSAIDTSRNAVSDMRAGAEKFTLSLEEHVAQGQNRTNSRSGRAPRRGPERQDTKTAVIENFWNRQGA